MADLCYLTFEADIISEPTKNAAGNLFFLAKTSPAGHGDIIVRILLRGAAAEKIFSMGDRIHITNGTIYVGKKSNDYLLNVAVEKEQLIHVISYDEGIQSVEKLTGGF